MSRFIHDMPKAELHVHLIGTLEPALMLNIAKRNNITLPYQTIEQATQAYRSYNNLTSFVAMYNAIAMVMVTEQDFYDVLYAYLNKAKHQNITYIEMFFEIQIYTPRGVSFHTIITGLDKARTDAQQALGIRCELILCFIRDFGPTEALQVLETSLAYKDKIIGIGLAGNEKNNPPFAFIELYKQAKTYGYKCCIHAGEEGEPEYIWQAIKLLQVDRIAHGVTCIQDPILIDYLVQQQIALTVCPLSNVKLNIYKQIEEHPIKNMLEQGLLVSIHSDDPAFFGSLDENYQLVHTKLNMNIKQLALCARNSFLSAFTTDSIKQQNLSELDTYISKQPFT